MHVYEPIHLEVYSKLLWHQLASLWNYPPRHPVKYWFCYTMGDGRINQVIDKFWNRKHPSVTLTGMEMHPCKLFRRAIGRHQVTAFGETGPEDIYWFGDCDYVFGDGCLDTLSLMNKASALPDICTLDSYFVQKTHLLGDELLRRTDIHEEPRAQSLNLKFDFAQVPNKRPIGGLQIVRGPIAAEGYLADTKWQQVVNPVDGFRETIEDRKYFLAQQKLGRKWEKISLPCLYRLRHSQRGAIGTYRRKRSST